ncbi:hypothetical protein Nepgr_033231 [Nepenthes gracilis]|uniref:Synaptonemal complex protein 1 n=1 Tax=Nepenthes gracilis TaxID=150966 RepID=A0AAD3TLX2_NEPGR|nr:hypothetical protein Nepgr_033231 [Nepenthes gracilis]
MQKFGLTCIKSLNEFKSLHGSVSGTTKTLQSSSGSPSNSITLGSFASLKLTAEKLINEQAAVRTDLDLANSKLKKTLEHVHTLEEKLQTALNENAKLKVKQKEDEKLWDGLALRFSSTKAMCDQLTQTLQVLAGQLQDAEKDKQLIEQKLSANSATVDKLNEQLNNMSIKLQSADEAVRDRDKELKELRVEKAEREAFYKEQQHKSAKLTEEKDTFIKCLEADVAANRLANESLKSELEDALLQLKLKEEDLKQMRVTIQNLEKGNADLHSSNNEFANKLDTSMQEKKHLSDMVNAFAIEISEMDKQSLEVLDKISQLYSMYDSFFKLVKEDRDLGSNHARQLYDQLNQQYLLTRSEKYELQSLNERLNDKVCELQRVQESLMVQHAEECRLTEETIRKLESEAEALVVKKSEVEKLVIELEEKVSYLSESLQSSENKMNDILLKSSLLESQNKEIIDKLQAYAQEKDGEIDVFQKEIEKSKQQLDFLEKKVNQLDGTLEEKEQLILQCRDREKQLKDQKAEIQALLLAAESKVDEVKKQYDAMLDSKQAELSRHLKEISQRNDQAINDIKKKYEVEKEIINLEKEKADKIVAEMKSNCEKRLEQCKEESRQHLKRVQEEHVAFINCMQQEHGKKESSIKADHLQELKHIQLQAENELREKTKLLRKEHEVQIRALRLQNEDERRLLQEELDLQKSKEERQRALLQLQWKVMSDKPHEDQEVNSKKDYSVSSIKMQKPDHGVRSTHAPLRPKVEKKDSPHLVDVQSPMSTLLKKVEKANSGTIMDISRHSRKVTHHEYEVETNNGGTITKRRKTKSTVMFGDPRKHKKAVTPKACTPRNSVKGTDGVSHMQASNIGDLFSEGSLNPYADDPYAFD